MTQVQWDQYLRYVELLREKVESFSKYPYCLSAIKDLSRIEFHPKVTYIVGENGTGKSTILEAIAIACGFNPEGGTRNFNFSTNDTHSDLYKNLKLVRGVKRPQDGFFLRAESFYNVATNIEEVEAWAGDPFASYGGVSLHSQSHGESFLSVIRNRFSGNGLYILDEPEAALSPSRQMSMLVIMHELIKRNSQFIVATHSPIIMSYPDSIIYEIRDGIKEVRYKDTEHYKITRDFLDRPEKMLEILLDEE
ncbi:ATP-binding cassette domain-containing protein [Clostridium botulinum]|nr:ATP-binding cassette domain-containing protein [Clostridium botulinum F str. Langeland]NFF56916.1 ATP-binding cassette domain-containing protein [Clostridium botulinum]NFL10946.1 ATP-binding cassette domain-containing protein [Clostridium botulinum]NFL14803.1 ATP-binding cassette domain-containing protein [Clostridium botulinum]NFL24024.1 ATP-binding cassette domain-containing protein [Clostridium botulinum]